jgi:hypothetical protein
LPKTTSTPLPMPLPTPQSNETSDQFLGRCMTDSSTNAEFPDAQQRLAVCGNLYANHKKQAFASYADYGEGVRNNAKRGIELNERNGNKCATQTGKVRAQQLANGEGISLETVKRMHSYLSRAETYYDNADSNSDCGYISYLLWGGKAALAWSRNKLRELGELDEG